MTRNPAKKGRLFIARTLRFALAILFVLTAGDLSAQALGVTYVEGQADVRDGTAWKGLSIGDDVRPDASVRLGKGSYLELSSADAHLTVSQPGTYSVQDLLEGTKKLRSSGTGTALTNTFSRLLSGPGRNQSVVMGVRGADQSKSDETSWVTSDVEVFLDDGRNYLASGDYGKAIEELQQALDAASDEEMPEAKYLIAYAYSLNGNTLDAVKEVSDLNPTGGEEWAPDFVLLKAKLLIDTNAFAQEVKWLVDNGAALSQDAQRGQVYYFLLALGYQGLSDAANAKANLAKTISISPSSDVGKAAAELAKNP